MLISRFSRKRYDRKIDLNTIKFAPAAILSRMAVHKNEINYFQAIIFILLLLFSMIIPSGWSQEWLRQLIVKKGHMRSCFINADGGVCEKLPERTLVSDTDEKGLYQYYT